MTNKDLEFRLLAELEDRKNKARIRALEAERDGILNSASWRITTPLREVKRWLKSPRQQCFRYLEIGINLKILPLSGESRKSIFSRISQLFGSNPEYAYERAQMRAQIDMLVRNTCHKKFASSDLAAQVAALIEHINHHSFAGKTSATPLVSIIIPVYGQLNYTLCLLASVLANLPKSSFEIIIVDDCSPDDSFATLSQLQGIRVLRNEVNQGFILSCNAAAKAAKGQYLYFLNNDTEVSSGWLDALVKTFDDLPGTGLVGSKLIFPDGSLQEAGGIIWQDGSAWNFGRGQDPMLPIYNYAREVDYCSGASIMVPKMLFEELGGFDERYVPAYCEDADLALQIRSKGYRVIYQPQSTVIHYEGITSGKDVSGGVKAYQVINMKKLYERWSERLQSHQPNGVDVDNAKDRRAKRRVLVVDQFVPSPNKDAGSVTAINLLILLREMDFQITFIADAATDIDDESALLLQRIGVEYLCAPYIKDLRQHVADLGWRYDLVFLFRPHVFDKYYSVIKKHCSFAKILYESADMHFLRIKREAELNSDPIKVKRSEDIEIVEKMALLKSDQSIIRSSEEFQLLCKTIPESKLSLFPLMLDIPGRVNGFNERRDLIFIGGFSHAPNADAVIYFVKNIFPLIKKLIPDIRLFVVGSRPPREILELESDAIQIKGYVEDLGALMESVRISVVPLRFGAGVKGKIGTALAAGLPTVSTSIGVEGMSLPIGEAILVADDNEAFAKHVADLYFDEERWTSLSQAGVDFAEKAWGADSSWDVLEGILAKLNFEISSPKQLIQFYK